MLPPTDEFFTEQYADEIWSELWRDIAAYSLACVHGPEIEECQASVIRTRRRAHTDPAAHEAARKRLMDVMGRYNRDALAMFQPHAPTPPTPTSTEGEI